MPPLPATTPPQLIVCSVWASCAAAPSYDGAATRDPLRRLAVCLVTLRRGDAAHSLPHTASIRAWRDVITVRTLHHSLISCFRASRGAEKMATRRGRGHCAPSCSGKSMNARRLTWVRRRMRVLHPAVCPMPRIAHDWLPGAGAWRRSSRTARVPDQALRF